MATVSEKQPKQSSWRYRARIAMRQPATLIGLVLVAFFAYIIIAPVVSLLLSAIQTAYGDEARTGTNPGSFTTYYIERVFNSSVSPIIFWEPLINTLIIAALAIVGALVIGVPSAWLIARTNLPGRKWFGTALIVPYMLPAWTFALAWLSIFKNRRVAGSPGWLETFGIVTPDWLAYGIVPISIIFSLHYAPFVILLVTSAVRNIPSDLEEAGQMLGASYSQRVRRIVLPLLRPSILSAATLILAKVIGEFGVTFVLGSPADMQVLSTTLYQSLNTAQGGPAAVIAAVMVVIGGLSLWIDIRFLRNAHRFTTVTGKGNSTGQQDLKSGKYLATGALSLLFTISVLLPLGVLALTTVMHTPGIFALDNFTLDYWIGHNLPTVNFRDGVLVSSELWTAMRTTLIVVTCASLGSGILGMITGYVVVRCPWRWVGTALRVMTFTPYLVPGIAFATAYLSLFAVQRGPVPALYGTMLLLILAMIADEMPFASRAGTTSMVQLGDKMEEAGQMLGANWWTRVTRLVFPLQRQAFASAVLLPFVSGVQSLSLVVVLATPGTEMLTTLSIGLVDSGYNHAANAVTLVICVLALLGTWLARKLFKADLSQGMGS